MHSSCKSLLTSRIERKEKPLWACYACTCTRLDMTMDRSRCQCRRTLRECMLLRHLRHENVIGLKELLLPSGRDFKDLYLVQDLMDTDLHQIIRSSQALSNEHLQYFIYQVMCAWLPCFARKVAAGLLL